VDLMKAIEATAMVGEDRKVTVQLPLDIAPGPQRIIVIVEGLAREKVRTWTTDDWPIHDAALVDPAFTMRREEIYGDDGR
jgi:hypothetical protein